MLIKYKTIHEFDYTSKSRHYKRDLIKIFEKEIKAMREKKLKNVDLMMSEADKVLNAMGNEENFITFSENLYTNSDQANKIKAITRMQILRGVTKNYVNFKEKHSKNINQDPEILSSSGAKTDKNRTGKFRVKNLGATSIINRGKPAATADKKVIPGAIPVEKKAIDNIILQSKNRSTNKLYSIYADVFSHIISKILRNMTKFW